MPRDINSKMDRLNIINREPIPSEGVEGDLTVRSTRKGLRLYVKYKNKWVAFSPEEYNKPSYWTAEWTGRWSVKDNNWYYTSTSYGPNYYLSSTTPSASTNLATSWTDDDNNGFVTPFKCRVKSYSLTGYTLAETNTFQLALLTGTPQYGGAGDTTLTQIGSAVTSASMAAENNHKIEQVGLNYPLNRHDMLLPALRRTTNNNSTSRYIHGSFQLVCEITE